MARKKITLGKEVMVSDPCYEVPTWCQIKVYDVLPGKYATDIKRIDHEDWGNRIAYLAAVHEDYVDTDFKWRVHPGEVGVDSGQAGIFSMETYRDDNISDEIGLGDGDISFFNQPPWDTMSKDLENGGERWYRTMCSRTLGKKQWGTYNVVPRNSTEPFGGVVSSSGLGDGSYTLYVAKVKGKVMAFCIDYGIDVGNTYPPGKKKSKLHPML